MVWKAILDVFEGPAGELLVESGAKDSFVQILDELHHL